MDSRIEPFIAYWRDRAIADIEYTAYEDNEGFVDEFLNAIEDPKILERARRTALEMLKADGYANLEAVTQTVLDEALGDVENYTFKLNKRPERELPGYIWSQPFGFLSQEHVGIIDEDEELKGLVEGLQEEGLLHAALHELRTSYPFAEIVDGKEALTGGSFWYQVHAAEEWTLDTVLDLHVLKQTLDDALGPAAKSGPENDDIVYRFEGTNASVAGAEARGMYVAALRPEQLRAEGAALGICVGRKDMGYASRLKAKELDLFSVRTEVGKPKFTIEIGHKYGTQGQPRGVVRQVKGKANRVPGFEPGKTALVKGSEVKIVTDFLLHLGFPAEEIGEIGDMAPGVRALQEAGIDPFAPPPARHRPKGEGRSRQPNPLQAETVSASPEVARMAQAAMDRAWCHLPGR